MLESYKNQALSADYADVTDDVLKNSKVLKFGKSFKICGYLRNLRIKMLLFGHVCFLTLNSKIFI
jgi:hypothetical protein